MTARGLTKTQLDVIKLKKLKHLGVTASTIREWARAEGLKVAANGRLSPALIDAYVAAHPRRLALPTSMPRRRKPLTARPPQIQKRKSEWAISKHAAQRLDEFGFSLDEVLDCLEQPEVTYEQPDLGYGEAIYQRGRVAVGVNVLSRTAKTVLLRQVDQWDHAS